VPPATRALASSASEAETAPAVETPSALESPREIDRPTVNLFSADASSVPRLGRYVLRGSRDSLVRQNERSDADALERIEDDADLADRISRGVLVPVPESQALSVNGNLPPDRRYCRPWTASFLTDLSRAHHDQFQKPLIVSSAVRTVEYQRHLMRRNHNAAAAEGDIVSPHLTGATIDIAKSGLSRRELAWMRQQLLTVQNQGLIDVEEEFRQACFHITVYKEYAPDQPLRQPISTSTKVAIETDRPSSAGDGDSDIQ
jgi:hypothetical protein